MILATTKKNSKNLKFPSIEMSPLISSKTNKICQSASGCPQERSEGRKKNTRDDEVSLLIEYQRLIFYKKSQLCI